MSRFFMSHILMSRIFSIPNLISSASFAGLTAVSPVTNIQTDHAVTRHL